LGKASEALKNSKWTILKKMISGFDQPLVRAKQQLIESSWLINYATKFCSTNVTIEQN
jgi:hypothetical protein